MADFNVRSDSVDVEQIMRQIRARIREKRGADYTEAELQELAKVKLEKFLDPRGVRSDLVTQFYRREHTPSPPLPKLDLTEFSIYGTHRGALRWIRQMLQPVLKLFFNPNSLVHFVRTQAHAQAAINEEIDRWIRKREQTDARMDPLYYEVLHNLVVELTRAGIEVHNMKMRVESLSSRMDFDERRGRSLEAVVEYRPGAVQRPAMPAAQGPPSQSPPPSSGRPDGARPESAARPSVDGPRPEGDGRRRRRRRRRRPGQTMADQSGSPGSLSVANSGVDSAPGPRGSTSTPPHEMADGREDGDSSNAGAHTSGSGAPLASSGDGSDDAFDDEASDQ